MYNEIEGRFNMEDLIFDEDCFIVGSRSFPYDKIEKLEITSEPLFAAYGILTMVYKGREVSIPFPRSSARKIRKALKELQRERERSARMETGQAGPAEGGPQNRTVQAGPASDPYEELKKLKELLDMDIITEEEFQKKKKDLLDL